MTRPLKSLEGLVDINHVIPVPIPAQTHYQDTGTTERQNGTLVVRPVPSLEITTGSGSVGELGDQAPCLTESW